jgi:hypothetical protein
VTWDAEFFNRAQVMPAPIKTPMTRARGMMVSISYIGNRDRFQVLGQKNEFLLFIANKPPDATYLSYKGEVDGAE